MPNAFQEALSVLRKHADESQKTMDLLDRQCRGMEALSPDVADLMKKAERDLRSMESSLGVCMDALRSSADGGAQTKHNFTLDRFREQIRFVKSDMKRHTDTIRRAELSDPSRLVQNHTPAGADYASAHLSRERDALDSTRRTLDDMRGVATTTWDMLRRQGQTLGTQSDRVGGILGNLSSSNSIMRTIARTDRLDSLLVYGGITVICVLMIMFVWLRPSRTAGALDAADL